MMFKSIDENVRENFPEKAYGLTQSSQWKQVKCTQYLDVFRSQLNRREMFHVASAFLVYLELLTVTWHFISIRLIGMEGAG